MILASVLYLVRGCFLDTTAMLVVTLPFLYPVVVALGINLFAVMGALRSGAILGDVYKGVIPIALLEIMVLVLLVLFPGLAIRLLATMIDSSIH
jgi:C4-dicarboxylate transporter DctM subunit